ncbi:MAG: type VI secretion system tube protein Hcp [Aquisalimonadaceae bacterium]
MSIFMHFEGIKGESADSNHKEWMDVRNLRWGVSRDISAKTSTQNDRESSNAEISDLTVTRSMDSASTGLFLESCCGKGKDVVLHLTKTGSGAGADVYVEYTLKNALISNYEVVANGQDTERPMEHITISFVDLEFKYIPYDEDGNALAAVAVGFDTATNTKR